MSSRRMKTLVIFMLITANVFLAAIYLTRVVSDRAETDRANREISEIAGRFGVKISPDAIPDAAPDMLSFEIRRRTELEREIVHAFFQEFVTEDRGGGIYFYESQSGYMEFRSGGYIDVFFRNQAASQTDIKGLEHLLQSFGISLKDVQLSENGSRYTVLRIQDGSPVFNNSLDIDFNENGFYKVSGRWSFGEIVPVNVGDIKDPATLILRFAEMSAAESIGEITGINVGYASFSTSPDKTIFIPVWQISTSDGIRYLNMQNSAAEQV